MVMGMDKLYMGIDVGSMYVKGVIIDEYDNIISSYCTDTLGNPINSVKKVILTMKEDIDLEKYKVVAVGVTGSARKLISAFLDGQVVKNEITALSVGVIRWYPNVKTIIDIGGEEAKIVIVKDGVVVDYAMNSSCDAGAGLFINSLARRLGIKLFEVPEIALSSKKKINITNRCMVFAESDFINKIQEGYMKEDVIAGACYAVAQNYVNGVAKGKKILEPIVFTGGVSKNLAVVKNLEEILDSKIIVNKNSYLMAAFGIALMARNSGIEKEFNFDINSYKLETKIANCVNCSSNCEIVTVYRNNNLIDMWGNKCEHTNEIKNM